MGIKNGVPPELFFLLKIYRKNGNGLKNVCILCNKLIFHITW